MPVSITGTVDSVTTVWIRPAPPRGMIRSTSPRAVSSARTASRPPSSSVMASAGSPWDSRPLRITLDQRPVGGLGGRAAAQDHGVAGLQAEARGIDGDVGAGLVDHADDAHRHPDLADLQAVGQRRATHHLPHRVGQRGDVAQRLGHGGDPLRVEGEPVEQALRHTGVAAPLEVVAVGGDDAVGGGVEGVGERVQRGVLVGAGQQRQAARGHSGGAGRGGHLLDGGGVDLSHAPRVCRVSRRPVPVPSAGRLVECLREHPVDPVLRRVRPRRQQRRRLPPPAARGRGVAGAHRALLQPHRVRRVARARCCPPTTSGP